MQIKLIMAVLDFVPRCFDWTDREIHEFCYMAGSAGVDKIRLMYWPIKDYPQPFERVSKDVFNLGSFEMSDSPYLDKELNWWKQLRRFANIARIWKIGIYFDFFDHCGTKAATRDINPWYNNCNDVDGIYEIRPHAIAIHKRWMKKVVQTIGLKRNWFGLGNELAFPGDLSALHEWAILWGYGLAKYLKQSLGYKERLLWSGEEKTAHALRGHISPEDYASVYGYQDTVIQYHGMDYVANALDAVEGTTRKRWVAFSDDGTNIKIPDLKAICVQGGKYCSATADTVIHTVKGIKEWVEDNPKKTRLHHIEQLPRSVSELGTRPSDMWKDIKTKARELLIYQKLANIWGKKVIRNYPDRLKRKYLGG